VGGGGGGWGRVCGDGGWGGVGWGVVGGGGGWWGGHALFLFFALLSICPLKPGSPMPPTYLGHSRRYGLGHRYGICEHLSPNHNLS